MKRKNTRKLALILMFALMPMFTNGCILTTLLGGAGSLIGGAVGAAGNLLGAAGGALLGNRDVAPGPLAGRVAGNLPR
jgi:hypothetical protein